MALVATEGVTSRGTVRLTAVVSDFERLMSGDGGARAVLNAHYADLFFPAVRRFEGRAFGVNERVWQAEFPEPAAALEAAIDLQRGLAERNADLAPERRIEFLIGLDMSDKSAGEGRHLARNLTEWAVPGDILLSDSAYDQVVNQLASGYDHVTVEPLQGRPGGAQVYRLLPAEPVVSSARRMVTSRESWRWAAVVGVAILIAVVLALANRP